jgi:hypothetical protein
VPNPAAIAETERRQKASRQPLEAGLTRPRSSANYSLSATQYVPRLLVCGDVRVRDEWGASETQKTRRKLTIAFVDPNHFTPLSTSGVRSTGYCVGSAIS